MAMLKSSSNQSCWPCHTLLPHTDLAEMASLRLFRALNMPLWLGGTRSAKATQSMAFRATRRAAILSVGDKERFSTQAEEMSELSSSVHQNTAVQISDSHKCELWLSLLLLTNKFKALCITSSESRAPQARHTLRYFKNIEERIRCF